MHVNNLRNAVSRFMAGLQSPSKAANRRLLEERGETLSSIIIREATLPDVPQIAALHVRTFNETWYGRSSPTYYIREYQWRQLFERADGRSFVFVAEKAGGELVGFAKGIIGSHAALPGYAGELNKICLLRQYQRLGLGRALWYHVARRFIDMGVMSMVVFDDPQHASCRFHEAMGGMRLYAANGEFQGAYGFPDLRLTEHYLVPEKNTYA